VGSTVPDVTGRRLDGTEDSLLAYRGRVVLIDFWATWCAPCVNTLPTLRELVAEMPADRFTLLSISVDDDRETVTRFMEDEPMPWANWYAGPGRDSIARAWGIRGFPTYVLVNDQGLVLARTLVFTPWLVSTLKRAVEAAPEPEDRGAVE
jgi:thiol-disulfide isomerase/thioredoxin